MPRAGLLVQMDGSHHPWLQARGPALVLLHAIDDATGAVLGAVFRQREDAAGYLLLLRHLARAHGLPVAVYTDQHGIFKRRAREPLTLEEQLRGRPEPTQVGRTLVELGIQWVPATSPQAKGRVERVGGTFQDRLVSELRLAHPCPRRRECLPLRLHCAPQSPLCTSRGRSTDRVSIDSAKPRSRYHLLLQVSAYRGE